MRRRRKTAAEAGRGAEIVGAGGQERAAPVGRLGEQRMGTVWQNDRAAGM